MLFCFSYDGQEGTIAHMRRQSGVDSTESITGTTYGGSTHLDTSSSGGSSMWKLSPQSLLATNTEDLPPQKLTKVTSQLSAVSEEDILQDSTAGISPSQSSQGMPHPLPQQNTSHSRSDNSIFGGAWTPAPSSVVDTDRMRVERLLDIFRGPCLLDCIEVNLTEVDVFSARRVPARGESFRIQRQEGKVLKEKGAAKLNIERNLYEDFCRNGEY